MVLALSLDEAWGDTVQQTFDKPVISARKSVHSPKEVLHKTKKPEPEEDNDREDPEKTITVIKQNIDLEQIINQFELLRSEQSKRSTIYIVIASLLFAILLWYIDKLNNRLSYLMMMQWKQGKL